jgi:hypothetical protein
MSRVTDSAYKNIVIKNKFNILSDTIIPHDYDETEAMNDKRRKLLNRSHITGLRIIFNWKYTLLVSVFFDAQLYSRY